jgi:hypothetical protein
MLAETAIGELPLTVTDPETVTFPEAPVAGTVAVKTAGFDVPVNVSPLAVGTAYVTAGATGVSVSLTSYSVPPIDVSPWKVDAAPPPSPETA